MAEAVTLCLNYIADPRKYQYFPKFDWPRINNPKLIFPLTKDRSGRNNPAGAVSFIQIQEAILSHPDEVACIIIEPIQAEGGDNHFRPEFFTSLREFVMITRFFDPDEIQTGIGMTGKMWAYEHTCIIPMLSVLAKKSQVCGIRQQRKMDQVEHHVFKESSRINSTFGGNLIDMLRFQLILEIIENENLVENALEL
jgi:L-lysine 6-transaminase